MLLRRLKTEKSPRDIDWAISRLIHFAHGNVTAYRSIWSQAGVKPQKIHGVADLDSLPIVTKHDLLQRFPLPETTRRGMDAKRCVTRVTSGTTGLPMTVFMSRWEAMYRRCVLLQAWRRSGLLHFPLRVVNAGCLLSPDEAVRIKYWGLVTVVSLSITQPVERQVQLTAKHKPQLLDGFPSSLQTLAEALNDSSAQQVTPRLVIARGELLHGVTRELLKETFRCPVADYYNSEEIGNIAWQCPVHPAILHVNTDSCVVEVVDDDGRRVPPGIEGRLVLTNLYNYTMPFIRYEIGDRGTILCANGTPCECGSRAPRMRQIDGRDDDFLFLPDGSRISPRALIWVLNDAFTNCGPPIREKNPVRRFQLVQDDLAHVTVSVIRTPGCNIDLHPVLGQAFRQVHPDLRYTIETVDDLPVDASGKFKKVVSKLAKGRK